MASGKTWSAYYLVRNYGYHKLSLAGRLKELAAEMYDITGKDGTDRQVLQELGTDLRKHDKDVWIKYLLNVMQFAKLTKIVIDDVRYLNEGNILRQNGFVLIRVSTDPKLREARVAHLYPNRPATALLHASETDHEHIREDYTTVNDKYFSGSNLDLTMSNIND